MDNIHEEITASAKISSCHSTLVIGRWLPQACRRVLEQSAKDLEQINIYDVYEDICLPYVYQEVKQLAKAASDYPAVLGAHLTAGGKIHGTAMIANTCVNGDIKTLKPSIAPHNDCLIDILRSCTILCNQSVIAAKKLVILTSLKTWLSFSESRHKIPLFSFESTLRLFSWVSLCNMPSPTHWERALQLPGDVDFAWR